MKILVINWQDWTNPLSGGAEIHLKEIFTRLVRRGHQVTLFCSHFPHAAQQEVLDGITIIRRGSRALFNYVVPLWYYRVFRHQHFDIVVDDLNKIPFYTPLYVREPLAVIAHHFFGRSIFLETNPIAGSYVYLAEKLVDRVYRNVSFAVVSQSTLEEYVQRGFPRENFTIIPNCIDQNAFPFRVREKTSYPSVAYFGRLKRYKSVDHVLRAFARLVPAFPKAKLFILGRGSFQPALERLAQQLGIADRTVFTGYVSEEEKVHYLSKVWVVVNPSMKEGWGITNIEANACGTPVVSADVPGLRDSVRHQETGLLYPYGDIEALAAAIRAIWESEPLRHRLSEGAVRWARRFDWEDSAAKMETFLHQVVEQGGGQVRSTSKKKKAECSDL